MSNNFQELYDHLTVELSADKHSVLNSTDLSTRIIPLVHYRTLSIKGPDCKTFLQGQLTCDLEEVYSRGSGLGAHCNIKGSMLSLFRLMRISDHEIWLRMRHDIFDAATTNLKKYMIFSKAEAEEISGQIAGIGVIGCGARALIEQLFENCPSEDDGVISFSAGLVIRVPGDRYEIWADSAKLKTLLQQLPTQVAVGSTNDWILSEIDAAIPDIYPATQEKFIPQMTNFQALNGVSFSKGCYTGQEIVTRLQHRGQLKKPMYLLEGKGEQLPQPGCSISSSEKANFGQVVQAANVDHSNYRLLAVINKSVADEQQLFLENSNEPLIVKTLPYILDEELFRPKS